MTNFGIMTFLALVPLAATPELKPAPENPRELGCVHWLRGYEQASAIARAESKPLLILFQEVPGCATCVGYGQSVLSHPLIVEVIETLFTPLVVYNNVQGEDGQTLRRFGEPAWNNPVIQIATADGERIVPRLAGNYGLDGLTGVMVDALRALGKEPPEFLRLLAAEARAGASELAMATFAMACFWTGEMTFGEIEGVVSTRPGFLDGHEVVRVTYDPEALSFAELMRRAQSGRCAAKVFTYSDDQRQTAVAAMGKDAVSAGRAIRPDSEPKYYLAQTPLRHLPMTAMQAARVNAAIGRKTSPARFLSPRQLFLLEHIGKYGKRSWPVVVDSPTFREDWYAAVNIATR